jgi:ammonia channel protein AmtB
MIWGGGILGQAGVIDFAGGLVVHTTCGVGALVAAIMLGNRSGFPGTAMPPHNRTMVMIGASMLWVGWFGFNAGSAVAADSSASMAMLGFLNSAAVGALTVAPSDNNVIYAGMGESTIRIDVSFGDGIYKSTSAGKTWKNIGLKNTRHVS